MAKNALHRCTTPILRCILRQILRTNAHQLHIPSLLVTYLLQKSSRVGTSEGFKNVRTSFSISVYEGFGSWNIVTSTPVAAHDQSEREDNGIGTSLNSQEVDRELCWSMCGFSYQELAWPGLEVGNSLSPETMNE
jgi:hypothetical protein